MKDALLGSDPVIEPTNELVVETRPRVAEHSVQVIDARSYIARSLGIMGLVGMALIHLLDSGSKFQETPYIFWLYVALMAASLIIGAALLHTESRLAWLAAGALAASAMVGYILSRTVGLPLANGDIGNWGEQLGLAALFIEGCVVALSVYRLVLIRPSRRLYS
jgi:hypothetical protein